jgi:DNA-binding Xre family transcriptional regulator
MNHGAVRVDANRLEAVLRLRKMSMNGLAEKLGMHPNSILRIKTTGGTNLGTLSELCNALECHPFDLLVAQGYPEPFYRAPASL